MSANLLVTLGHENRRPSLIPAVTLRIVRTSPSHLSLQSCWPGLQTKCQRLLPFKHDVLRRKHALPDRQVIRLASYALTTKVHPTPER
jgi:hypothetical protein